MMHKIKQSPYAIPLLLILFYMVLMTPLMGRKHGYTVDANGVFNLTKRILETGNPLPPPSILVPPSIAENPDDPNNPRSFLIPKQGYIYSVIYIPFYLLGDGLYAAGIGPTADWTRRKCLCWMNIVITALTLGLLSITLARMRFSTQAQIAIPLLFGLTTLAFCYARYDYNKSLAAFLLITLFYFCVCFLDRHRTYYAWLVGGTIALLITLRLEMGIVLPVVLLTLLLSLSNNRKRFVHGLGILLPALGGIAFVLFYNHYYWGGGIAGGYTENQALNPFAGLSGFLLSPGKNVWLYNPILLMLLAVLPLFKRRDSLIFWTWSGMLLSLLLVYSTWGFWWGGWCYGPRHLVPLLPLAVIPLALVMDDPKPRWRGWLIVLGLLGLAVQFLGSAIDFNDIILFLEKRQEVTHTQMIWHPLWNPVVHHALFIRSVPLSRWDFLLIDINLYFSPMWFSVILSGWLSVLTTLVYTLATIGKKSKSRSDQLSGKTV